MNLKNIFKYDTVTVCLNALFFFSIMRVKGVIYTFTHSGRKKPLNMSHVKESERTKMMNCKIFQAQKCIMKLKIIIINNKTF